MVVTLGYISIKFGIIVIEHNRKIMWVYPASITSVIKFVILHKCLLIQSYARPLIYTTFCVNVHQVLSLDRSQRFSGCVDVVNEFQKCNISNCSHTVARIRTKLGVLLLGQVMEVLRAPQLSVFPINFKNCPSCQC